MGNKSLWRTAASYFNEKYFYLSNYCGFIAANGLPSITQLPHSRFCVSRIALANKKQSNRCTKSANDGENRYISLSSSSFRRTVVLLSSKFQIRKQLNEKSGRKKRERADCRDYAPLHTLHGCRSPCQTNQKLL